MGGRWGIRLTDHQPVVVHALYLAMGAAERAEVSSDRARREVINCSVPRLCRDPTELIVIVDYSGMQLAAKVDGGPPDGPKVPCHVPEAVLPPRRSVLRFR